MLIHVVMGGCRGLLITLRLCCLNRLMFRTFATLDKWFWRLFVYEFLEIFLDDLVMVGGL